MKAEVLRIENLKAQGEARGPTLNLKCCVELEVLVLENLKCWVTPEVV